MSLFVGNSGANPVIVSSLNVKVVHGVGSEVTRLNITSVNFLLLGCPVSTYKPNAGPGLCQLCPPNSTSEGVAASSKCICSRSGFVWHQQPDGDGHGACVRKLTSLRMLVHSLFCNLFWKNGLRLARSIWVAKKVS